MSEVASFNTLRSHVGRPRDRWTRIENLVEVGTPDANLTLAGRDVWLEIKSPKEEPKRDTTALLRSQHKLTIEQRNWFLTHTKAGGLGFIYIDGPTRRYLVSARHADAVNDWTPGELMLKADWTGPTYGCSPALWLDLRVKLCGSSA